jgi:hypothetical protein
VKLGDSDDTQLPLLLICGGGLLENTGLRLPLKDDKLGGMGINDV